MDPAESEASAQNGHIHTLCNGDSAPLKTADDHDCQSRAHEDPTQHVVPPFWHGHARGDSRLSLQSVDNSRPTPIRLEDHTLEGSEHLNALWARHVVVEDYVIVGGAAPGVGSYVVWNVTVETLDGGPIRIRKRYSEFDDLRKNLVRTFPHAAAAMPQLPPKSVISRFRSSFLEKRRAGLSYFLNCILLNPEFAGSPVLKDFLFV